MIFISLLYLISCTTLVLVYLAWSPCTTLVLVHFCTQGLHLRCSSPLCSLSCHPHRFFLILLCQSGGFAALLRPYLGGVASEVIFISLLYLISCTTLVLVYLALSPCTTLVLVYLAWSPCTTLVLVYLAWSPWVYLDIHIRGYIWHGLLALHWYWSIWHGLLGYIWIYTLFFWWPSCCLWLKFQWTVQHSTLG